MGFRPHLIGGGLQAPASSTAGPFSDVNYFTTAAGSLPGWDLGANTTLVVVLNPTDPSPATHDWIPICYRNPAALGTHGWQLTIMANGDGPFIGMYYIAGGAVLLNQLGSLPRIPGQPVRIVFVDNGTNVRVTVNGSPVVVRARAAYSAGTATERAVVGALPVAAPGYASLQDAVSSFAIIGRAVSDVEAIAESGRLSSWDIALAADAACTVDGYAKRDYPVSGPSWVTHGSTPTTLVTQGVVASSSTLPAPYVGKSLTQPDDTGMWVPVTGAGVTYHRVTNEARWTIDTDAEELVVSQVVNEGTPYFTQLAIRKDGVAQTPVVNGAFVQPYQRRESGRELARIEPNHPTNRRVSVSDYRTFFDKQHIGAWDLGGRDVVVVIEAVKGGKVGHGEKAGDGISVEWLDITPGFNAGTDLVSDNIHLSMAGAAKVSGILTPRIIATSNPTEDQLVLSGHSQVEGGPTHIPAATAQIRPYVARDLAVAGW